MANASLAFDPVAAFLRRPIHEIITPSLPSDPTPPPPDRSVSSLRHLAANYHWAQVLNLSSSLLADDEPDNSSTSLQPHERLICESFRALALLQTRQIERAADALASLGDTKRYTYERFPDIYDGKTGDFVPFEIRLLMLDIKIRQGEFGVIPQCYQLRQELLDQEETGKSVDKELNVLLSAIASYHLKARQADAAVDIAKELLDRRRGDPNTLYMYARVLLHVGDYELASHCIDEAKVNSGEAMYLAHRGMLLAAQKLYQEALTVYDAALAADESERADVWLFVMNNSAICLVHLGRLAEAIDRIESCLRRNPGKALDEGVVFNLCTLYDLAYPDTAQDKRAVIAKLAARFGREGFDMEQVAG